MTRPTIAHVITESLPFGGAQRNTLLTLEGLTGDGYQTELICGPGGPLIDCAAKIGVPVHVIENLIRPVAPKKDFAALVCLYRLFRARKYHIVHTHSTKAGFLGRLAASWAGVPVIIHTVHGVPFEIDGSRRARFYISLERLVGSRTHGVICVGEFLRQGVAAWNIVPDEKLFTVYSGIDFSSYVPRYSTFETKQQHGLSEAWPIVGCIGRLSEQKAQRYLVEAVALLKDKYPHIKLILIGEGEFRPFLEEQVHRLALSSNISLLGEYENIADLLDIFDVYAMSSQWEGVGRALTEAMYWGLPVIATPVNGVKELIHHERTGLLVPTRAPTALAAAIDRLVSDSTLAKQLGANARQKALELMDGRRMVLAIEEIYRTLSQSKDCCGKVG
jgi:glycosyltransferase involved in cell wall biosynthesis